jgi:hypothetical protein
MDASFPAARALDAQHDWGIFAATTTEIRGLTPTPSSSTYITDTETQLDDSAILSGLNAQPFGLTFTMAKGMIAAGVFFALLFGTYQYTENIVLSLIVATVFGIGGGAALGFIHLSVPYAIFAILVLGAGFAFVLKRA